MRLVTVNLDGSSTLRQDGRAQTVAAGGNVETAATAFFTYPDDTTSPRVIPKMTFFAILQASGGMDSGEILSAMNDQDLVMGAFWLTQGDQVDLNDATSSTRALLTGMVTAGYLTAPEKAAVIAAWP